MHLEHIAVMIFLILLHMNINLIFLIDVSITFFNNNYESTVNSSASSKIIVLCF